MAFARVSSRRQSLARSVASSRMEVLESRLLMHDVPDPLPAPVDPTTPPLPHADNPTLQAEHMAVMALVPVEHATNVAVNSGNWSDPATWLDGLLPGDDAHVLVSAGVTLTVDQVYPTPLHWIRADGTLRFATDHDTGLVVDTIVVTPTGSFEMGTAAQPVAPEALAKVIFAGGDIDTTWDPRLLSRGLVSHGSVSIYGSHVTSYVPLDGNALTGTTVLNVTADPAGWKVGDRLILTGTSAWNTEDDEQLSVVAINGRQVTVEALKFDHFVTVGSGGGIYLANVSRNAVLESADPTTISRRGHVMFMHSDKVVVDSAGFYGLGRTDKRNAFDDAKLDEVTGAFTPGYGTNPRGRYAVHFHRTGLAHVDQPAIIRGSAVVDSPGWGFVNHSSNVVMEDNVAYDVIGAAFTTEAGDEIGAFRRNLAVKSTGSGAGIEDREDVQDFGHQGDGFWFQGGGVEVVGNIAVGQKHAGFVYFTQGLTEAGLGTREFLASNLADPSIAAGAEHIAVADVPIRLFSGNEAFANGDGFESWFHMLNAKHTAPSVVDGFRAWNNASKAMFIPYTNRLVVRNSTLTGNVNKPSSTGIGRNDVTKNITYENNTIAGFRTGIDAPLNGTSFVTGGVFNNGVNILVSTANERGRSLEIGGGVVFLSPAADALAAAGIESHYDISLRANYDPKHQDITRLFNPDVIKLGTVKYNGVQLYYNEQAADFVPFVKGEAEPYIPRCLLNKTNAQLWAKFGIAVGGTVAPKDAVRDPLINAMIGAPATYLPRLSLASAKYTNNVTGYKLSYRDEAGNKVTETAPTHLREGWNLLVRRIGGVNRTFFVFGDTMTPTFELAADQSLVLNPADLKTGFTLRGSVVDNSFGRMNFKRKFKDLDLLPLQIDADGVTKYINLSFTIKDFARNTVTVQLKVIVDPTAPLQKDIGRKVFGKKQISATLVALLGFRDRDAA